MSYYGDVIREAGAEAEIIFANDCRSILAYTKNVLNCDIHTSAHEETAAGSRCGACHGYG